MRVARSFTTSLVAPTSRPPRSAPARTRGAPPVRDDAPEVAARLAYAFALLREGRAEEAIADLASSLEEGLRSPLVILARDCATNARPQQALDILGLIGHFRPDLLTEIAGDAAFAPLRDDPRYLQLVGEL